MTDSVPDPAPVPAPLPLRRTTFVQPDGRRIHVYGEVRGTPPADAPRSEPTATPPAPRRAVRVLGGGLPGTQRAPAQLRAERRRHGARQPRRALPLPALPGRPRARLRLRGRGLRQSVPHVHPRARRPSPTSTTRGSRLRSEPARSSCSPSATRATSRRSRRRRRPASSPSGATGPRTCGRIRGSRASCRSRTAAARSGATLSHPHGQIYAFGHLPPWIERRVAALEEGRAHDRILRLVRRRRRRAGLRAARPRRSRTGRWASRSPRAGRSRSTSGSPTRCAPADRSDGRSRGRSPVRSTRSSRATTGSSASSCPYMMVVHEAPHGAADWHLAVELYPPHRSERLTKIRASVETSTLLFINDTLPEESAARLQAVPVDPREEHPGFVVVPRRRDGPDRRAARGHPRTATAEPGVGPRARPGQPHRGAHRLQPGLRAAGGHRPRDPDRLRPDRRTAGSSSSARTTGERASFDLDAIGRNPGGMAGVRGRDRLGARRGRDRDPGLPRDRSTSSLPRRPGSHHRRRSSWPPRGRWSRIRRRSIRSELAGICQRAENAYVGMNCGLMDQFASACGVAGAGDAPRLPLSRLAAGGPAARHAHARGDPHRLDAQPDHEPVQRAAGPVRGRRGRPGGGRSRDPLAPRRDAGDAPGGRGPASTR